MLQGGAMNDGADRRVARRFNMSLPLRIVPCGASKEELKTQTRDLSYQGLYFVAEAPMKKGSEIDFVITLPEEITMHSDVNIKCRGQVVRVQKEENGHSGIAAKIERYEFVQGNPPAA
jgi:c-di-GMP-binding flagellar brake protein YcgR